MGTVTLERTIATRVPLDGVGPARGVARPAATRWPAESSTGRRGRLFLRAVEKYLIVTALTSLSARQCAILAVRGDMEEGTKRCAIQ